MSNRKTVLLAATELGISKNALYMRCRRTGDKLGEHFFQDDGTWYLDEEGISIIRQDLERSPYEQRRKMATEVSQSSTQRPTDGGGSNGQQSATTPQQSSATDTTIALVNQLTEKDRQIAELQREIAELQRQTSVLEQINVSLNDTLKNVSESMQNVTASLTSTTQALHEAQALHAGSIQSVLMRDGESAPVDGDTQPQGHGTAATNTDTTPPTFTDRLRMAWKTLTGR